MAVINHEKCIGCETCIPYCPVNAFKKVENQKKVYVDQDICTKCNVCIRGNVCPVDAIEDDNYETFDSTFQHVLSDPTTSLKGSSVPGRGTEEMKTNDVTARFKKGEYGICIDMGRPGIGVRLRDAEKVAMAVAAAGMELEGPECTPLAQLMTDLNTGKLQDDVLDLNILSIIVEGKCSPDKVGDVLKALQKVEKEIDTVFSLGIVARVDENGHSPIIDTIEELGIPKPVRGKLNVGLGRPLID